MSQESEVVASPQSQSLLGWGNYLGGETVTQISMSGVNEGVNECEWGVCMYGFQPFGWKVSC